MKKLMLIPLINSHPSSSSVYLIMSTKQDTMKPLAPLPAYLSPRLMNDKNEHNDRNEHHLRLKTAGAGAGADLRWSEVVPPNTALTFAAMWDPEDGLVTFEGAALSACTSSEEHGKATTPKDADERSQVLTLDFANIMTSPNTAQDSMLYPYSRFAVSELSVPHHIASPTRRSSAGTGGFLDTFVRSQLQPQTQLQSAKKDTDHPHGPNFNPELSRKAIRSRFKDRLSPSHDSGLSGRLSSIGSGLYHAFRRDSAQIKARSFTRAERYKFLRRTAAKATDDCGEGKGFTNALKHAYDSDGGVAPKSKLGGLRGILVGSGRSRSDDGAHHSAKFRTVFASSESITNHNTVPLGTNLNHTPDHGDASNAWLGYFGNADSEGLDLELALKRDIGRLKSTFSWTTTSTSRYVDVAKALREIDTDSDTSLSSFASPSSCNAAPNAPQDANLSLGRPVTDADSEWLPIEVPVLTEPGLVVNRKLLKKSSKVEVNNPPLTMDAPLPPLPPSPSLPPLLPPVEDSNVLQYRICPQCRQLVVVEDLPDEDVRSDVNSKGKVRARSLSEDNSRQRGFGRPGVPRSSSSPASLPVLSGKANGRSNTASPEEVLSRGSYNHEWSSSPPTSSISHTRSSSAPGIGLAGRGVSAISATVGASSAKKTCQHMSDVLDVLRGVQSAMRSSTPVPGMPSVPMQKYRAATAVSPPTSFRPIPLSGRTSATLTRHQIRSPLLPTAFSRSPSPPQFSETSPLKRSRSHGGSTSRTQSLRLRTRSLQSISDVMHGLVSTSPTRPLRRILSSRSRLRRNSNVPNSYVEDDGAWVRVDMKSRLRAATKPAVDVDSGIHLVSDVDASPFGRSRSPMVSRVAA
ncbi:hypothetical protein EW145_g6434 [Phellinidium pouzarii]|uniref:Uncharacterized protein n=1 Tax=Phellinidium pouzarii TaxID=167371 RepID=A0A4S4L1B9_9AGAM|nr:hypothetical protein EW145_g6434 [Phellinidium pouzarii]